MATVRFIASPYFSGAAYPVFGGDTAEKLQVGNQVFEMSLYRYITHQAYGAVGGHAADYKFGSPHGSFAYWDLWHGQTFYLNGAFLQLLTLHPATQS